MSIICINSDNNSTMIGNIPDYDHYVYCGSSANDKFNQQILKIFDIGHAVGFVSSNGNLPDETEKQSNLEGKWARER